MWIGLASPLHMTILDCLGRPGPQTVGPQRLLIATMLWPEKPKFSLFNSPRVSSGQRLHLKHYDGQTSVLNVRELLMVVAQIHQEMRKAGRLLSSCNQDRK